MNPANTDEEYARFDGVDGVETADKTAFPAYYHYDPTEGTYTIYVGSEERRHSDKDEWADDWKTVPTPFLPEAEFDEVPTEDDFEFVVFPDDDNTTYDEPQRYEQGELRPLFSDDHDTDDDVEEDQPMRTDG